VASCAAIVAPLLELDDELELELLELELLELAAATLMENAGSDVDNLPSLTVITMLLYVPPAAGAVPHKFPLIVLNVSQLGLLTMVKPSLSKLASFDVGANTYHPLALIDVTGLPVIDGATFGAACTEAATRTNKNAMDVATR
jgi:hypothetical protein